MLPGNQNLSLVVTKEKWDMFTWGEGHCRDGKCKGVRYGLKASSGTLAFVPGPELVVPSSDGFNPA